MLKVCLCSNLTPLMWCFRFVKPLLIGTEPILLESHLYKVVEEYIGQEEVPSLTKYVCAKALHTEFEKLP